MEEKKLQKLPNGKWEYLVDEKGGMIVVADTKEEAERATEEGQWNIVLWIFSLPFGEYRWLKSKTYNNIHYEYFDRDMTKPFKELMD